MSTNPKEQARDEAIEQLVQTETEVIDNLPARLTKWIEKQQPLERPLKVVEEESNDSCLCLPYTENDDEYTEATACENRERAVNILYGDTITDRTRLLVDYDLTWSLDVAYGSESCLELAIMVSELCPYNRGFVYHHLGNQLVQRAQAAHA